MEDTIIKPFLFNTVLQEVRGALVAPYLLHYKPGMLPVLYLMVYSYQGTLIDIEVSNLPEGTMVPEDDTT